MKRNRSETRNSSRCQFTREWNSSIFCTIREMWVFSHTFFFCLLRQRICDLIKKFCGVIFRKKESVRLDGRGLLKRVLATGEKKSNVYIERQPARHSTWSLLAYEKRGLEVKNLYRRSALKTRSERNEKQKLSKKTDHGSFNHKELIVAICSVLSSRRRTRLHEMVRDLSSRGAHKKMCVKPFFS